MNRTELVNLHKELTDEGRNLMVRKNEDYAGLRTEHTVFGNLGICESMGICNTEMGILIRITDKISRLSNVLQKPAAVDESVRDTIVDGINYLVLLYAKVVDRASAIISSEGPETQPGNQSS